MARKSGGKRAGPRRTNMRNMMIIKYLSTLWQGGKRGSVTGYNWLPLLGHFTRPIVYYRSITTVTF